VTYDDLISYAAGGLDDGTRRKLQAHLASSPADRKKVVRIRSALETMRQDDSCAPASDTVERARGILHVAAAQAGERWWKRLIRVAAEVVFDSRLQPALGGFRGRGDDFQLSYDCPIAEVDLQCRPDEHERGDRCWTLTGQVSSKSDASRAEIALLRSDSSVPVQTVQADNFGVFHLKAARGDYNLLVCVVGEVLELTNIELN